jgi:hypothetical protein
VLVCVPDVGQGGDDDDDGDCHGDDGNGDDDDDDCNSASRMKCGLPAGGVTAVAPRLPAGGVTAVAPNVPKSFRIVPRILHKSI